MQRRDFLKSTIAAAVLVSFCPQAIAKAPLQQGWYCGFKDLNGRYGVCHISTDLKPNVLFHTPLRLHGISKHPKKNILAAPSRRPDPDLYVFDLDQQSMLVVKAEEGRHFYGHGVFSEDGSLYFATENDFEEERGIIGIYDTTQNFKRIGEMESGGIGPHELRLFNNQLIISNGGILTHPDMGRAKLNLQDMAPNVSFIDLASRKVTQQLSLPEELHQLSIRHMDVNDKGTVYIGTQDQRDNRYDVPLVWQSKNDKLVALAEPKEGWKVFKGYIGSVCATETDLCVTSPIGGLAHIWTDQQTSIFKKDICGLSKVNTHDFLLTTGQGIISNGTFETQDQSLSFDNHCALA